MYFFEFSHFYNCIYDALSYHATCKKQELFADRLFYAYYYQNIASCDAKRPTISRPSETTVYHYLEPGVKLPKDLLEKYLSATIPQAKLEMDIQNRILPLLDDPPAVIHEIVSCVSKDDGWSNSKKEKELLKDIAKDGTDTAGKNAAFLARVLLALLYRNSKSNHPKYAPRIKPLVDDGYRSLSLKGTLAGCAPDKPCTYFLGRESELNSLKEKLLADDLVFLTGIAGIGKSELVRKYAAIHKTNYTNIIYISHERGQDLTTIFQKTFRNTIQRFFPKADIGNTNLLFEEMHKDTLLIIDNYNQIDWSDSQLREIKKYRCHVIIITRDSCNDHNPLLVKELEPNILLDLMQLICKRRNHNPTTLSKIVECVHRHTLAVDLAARVLNAGFTSPDALVSILSMRAKGACTEAVPNYKDNGYKEDTYFGHIITLFGLFQMNSKKQAHLRNLAFIPNCGIPHEIYLKWMGLPRNSEISELVEFGFVQENNENIIKLVPMIREAVFLDLVPSVRKCSKLLNAVTDICFKNGDDEIHDVLCSIVLNILDEIENDHSREYLDFAENVWPYFDSFSDTACKNRIIEKIAHKIQELPEMDWNEKDHELYVQYRTDLSPDEKIAAYQMALRLSEGITPENACRYANICNHLAVLHCKTQNLSASKHFFDKAFDLFHQYNLTDSHDYYETLYNYTLYLLYRGETQSAEAYLINLLKIIPPEVGDILVDIHQTLAQCYCAQDPRRALEHAQYAMDQASKYYKRAPQKIIEISSGLETVIKRIGKKPYTYYLEPYIEGIPTQ